MKRLVQSVSFLGLGLTLVPSLFVFAGTLSLEHYKLMMLAGTMIWLCTAPFWVNGRKKNIED